MDNDFTQLSPARVCSFPELKVYVRHRDCSEACSWSLYTIERGNKINTSGCRGIAGNVENSPIKNTVGSIKLFPVPSQNEINIVIPESETNSETMPYSIYNAQSKLIKKGTFKSGKSMISISELPVGVYFIHTFTNKPITLTFVKQ